MRNVGYNSVNQMDYSFLLDYMSEFGRAFYLSAIIFISQIPNDWNFSGLGVL